MRDFCRPVMGALPALRLAGWRDLWRKKETGAATKFGTMSPRPSRSSSAIKAELCGIRREEAAFSGGLFFLSSGGGDHDQLNRCAATRIPRTQKRAKLCWNRWDRVRPTGFSWPPNIADRPKWSPLPMASLGATIACHPPIESICLSVNTPHHEIDGGVKIERGNCDSI